MSAIVRMNHKYEVSSILQSFSIEKLCDPKFSESGQMSITTAGDDDLYGSIGSLFDYATAEFVARTQDFTKLHSDFKGTYLESVIENVSELAASEGVKIGRVRLMKLEPLRCYSYHRDPEEFRYHIPLTTNRDACFIVGDEVGRMPDLGYLYKFMTREYHSAFNCSTTQTRMHLVFDTYID